jgi:hypothetical protein
MNAHPPPTPAASPARDGWSFTDTCTEMGLHTVSLRRHHFRRTGHGPELTLRQLRDALSDHRWLPSPMVHRCRLSSLVLELDGDALWVTNRSRLRLAVMPESLAELVAPAGLGTLGLLGDQPVTPAAARLRVNRLNKALLGCTRRALLASTRDGSGESWLVRVADQAVPQPRFYRTVARLARRPALTEAVVVSADVELTRCQITVSTPDAPAVPRQHLTLDRFGPVACA